MKLIDADEFDEELAQITPNPAAAESNPLIKAIPQVIALFRKRLADEPAVADAVVVVRCQECRYRPTCKLYAIHHELDNFCRKGVKIGVLLSETVSVPDGLEPRVQGNSPAV